MICLCNKIIHIDNALLDRVRYVRGEACIELLFKQMNLYEIRRK